MYIDFIKIYCSIEKPKASHKKNKYGFLFTGGGGN